MAFGNGPRIVTNGLVLSLDAGDRNSYVGSGTLWNDLSGNNNSGSLINGPAYSSTNSGNIVFDGINDYSNIGLVKYQYQDTFTVESFFYVTDIPTNTGAQCSARYPIIYNHDYGYNLLVNNVGKTLFQIYNTNASNAGVLSTNTTVATWIHAVGYKAGTEIGLYINGTLQQTNTLTTNAVYYDTNNPFVIGGFATCGANKFYTNGKVSIIKIYNRVLSASEVLQNYNAQKSRFGL